MGVVWGAACVSVPRIQHYVHCTTKQFTVWDNESRQVDTTIPQDVVSHRKMV